MLWQYVNSMDWIVSLGEGDIGVHVWFGAPILHKMSNLHLAWHWHDVCEHVHLRSQSGIVCSGGLFGWFVVKIACIGQREEPGGFVGL
jgi:hypothetical protein